MDKTITENGGALILITIDVLGRTPIYEQICQSICREISLGTYKEGDRIPAARALAKELGLNPNTVAKAYGILEREGIIYSVAGRGCFIAKHKTEVDDRLTNDFRELTDRLLASGIEAPRLKEIIDEQAEERGKTIK
jgi:GntR family transcriptional regulator